MRIAVAGGGPGGLYAALLLKEAMPESDITVYDRNPADATYGWGVVFSDETLGFLSDADPESYARIAERFVHWEAIDIFYRGECIRSGGHAFSGLSRRTLLAILQGRCRAVGVDLRFESVVSGSAALPNADLMIAADGFNSVLRNERAERFQPNFDVHRTMYMWLGVRRPLGAFTFDFRKTEHGMFQVHAYPFGEGFSTCIVECSEAAWKRAGLEGASEGESLRFCEKLFVEFLQGNELFSNRSAWINFVTLRNENWFDGNVVLLGDAAHTAHFSIGSGTKMAMEDAITLSHAVTCHRENLRAALIEYEELRRPVVERTQQAARDSSMWFEHVDRYAQFDPIQFAFSLLTRSKRVTYENLKLRDGGFSERVDRWFASHAMLVGEVAPNESPLEVGMRLEDLVLENRRVRAGEEGVDKASNAGRPGLVMTRTIAVSPEGRITPDCEVMGAGDAATWEQRVRSVRKDFGARVGAVIGHAGPRGATRPRSEGTDLPLRSGGWPLLAASAVRYSTYAELPREFDRAEMDRVREDFVQSATLARNTGFDLLELDFSHGYLLATFVSPLTNRRSDEYGGALHNRLRYPLEVFDGVRAVWPIGKPLVVSLSATDWAPGGTTLEEAIEIAGILKRHGCTMIHVVTGQTVFRANPAYGRSWEAPFADAIRNEAHVPVLVGGNITSEDEANTILAAGRADLCFFHG